MREQQKPIENFSPIDKSATGKITEDCLFSPHFRSELGSKGSCSFLSISLFPLLFIRCCCRFPASAAAAGAPC